MSKCILIAGGGTGGHISPGIALYEKFKENGNTVPLFITGKRDIISSSIKDVDGENILSYSAPAFTKNIFKLPIFFISFTSSVFKSVRIIRKKKVSAVVGMGGYVSAPALVAAIIMRVPIFLCEQNTVPGKVTLYFEKYSEKIFGTFPESISYLQHRDKYVHSGNPIRNKVLVDISKDEARKAFHLEHCDRVIFVIGGSQGALNLNELMFGLKKKYSSKFKNIGIIWSTGEFLFEIFKNKTQNELETGSIYLSPYIKCIGLAYKACDIAISRSGAGVMMELAAVGIPSILIPYPFAAMDHQNKNADSFASVGAAIKIVDSDAVPEKVGAILFDLLGNSKKLGNMSRSVASVAMVDAADTIVKKIDQFLTNRGL